MQISVIRVLAGTPLLPVVGMQGFVFETAREPNLEAL